VTEPRSPLSPPSQKLAQDRLDSWKQIAQYLQRDESTVQRWEKREGMPVHRHVHDKRGSVYAFADELDAWWHSRRHQLDHTIVAAADRRIGIESAGRPMPRRQWRWALGVVTGIAVAASLFPWKWTTRTPANASLSLIRLTSTSGLNTDPALSPDGALLAYTSDRANAGNLDIWVQPTRDESPTRITSDVGNEIEPSFSADGTLIVFSEGEAGGIYAVSALGGAPRLIVPPARTHTPRLSPDGRWVMYWTGVPAWEIPGPSGASGALFAAPMAGGTPRAIAPRFADARYGVWSPHGESVLFLGSSESALDQSLHDWYVARIEGGEPIKTGAVAALRAAGVSGMPIPGVWREDGVTFATYDEGRSNVWRLGVSPSTGRAVGVPQRLTFGTAIERGPSVSVSGRVAFASVAENVDVWRVPLDSIKGVTTATLQRVTDNASSDEVINASDDDRQMVFVSSRTGRAEVWLKDMITGRERQITYTGTRSSGRISHGGTLIAVDRGLAEKRGIDLIPAAGGPGSPLCDDCAVADWSADDSRLLIERNGSTRLSVLERASGHETVLVEHPSWHLYQARFSPDGRWVAFHTTNSPALRQIYAVSTMTGGPVPFANWIPIVTDFGIYPNWSPDGAAIYHFSPRDGAFCEWLQPLDPVTKRPIAPPRAVQHFHQPRLRAGIAAGVGSHVSTNYLYVTLTESLGNIWMLEGQ
jgi:Tol biopolymer transport system component